MRRYVWVPLALASVAAMWIGVHDGQYQTVKSWALTLCTSCIGLGR
ncbi:MAG: hypothetical protein HPY69_07880 [Armatimonadetes bacterium]|nr:hypothetical protein [Armatimonadota bacterium]